MSNDTQAICGLCGEPMPYGEEMFKYHGHSGPCPKPQLQASNTDDEPISPAVARAKDYFWRKANEYEKAGRHDELRAFYNDMIELQQRTDVVSISKVLDALDPVLQLLDAADPA
jgi:hypothetical protein